MFEQTFLLPTLLWNKSIPIQLYFINESKQFISDFFTRPRAAALPDLAGEILQPEGGLD